jgi:hypothetical protein
LDQEIYFGTTKAMEKWDNNEMNPEEYCMRMWTGFRWPSTGTCGRLL